MYLLLFEKVLLMKIKIQQKMTTKKLSELALTKENPSFSVKVLNDLYKYCFH